MKKEMISPSDYVELDIEGGTGFSTLDLPDNISPRMYFDFAKNDLESGISKRTKINAFCNARRALCFQLEIIAKAFGFEKLSKKKYTSFPQKLEFCQKCGVIGPQILKKLNRTRNLVEHEYYIPTEVEVKDLLDVVELFLAATDHFIFSFPEGLEISVSHELNKDLPEIICVDMPPNKGIIYLLVRPEKPEKKEMSINDIDEWRIKNSIKIEIKNEVFYYKWVKLIVDNVVYYNF